MYLGICRMDALRMLSATGNLGFGEGRVRESLDLLRPATRSDSITRRPAFDDCLSWKDLVGQGISVRCAFRVWENTFPFRIINWSVEFHHDEPTQLCYWQHANGISQPIDMLYRELRLKAVGSTYIWVKNISSDIIAQVINTLNNIHVSGRVKHSAQY